MTKTMLQYIRKRIDAGRIPEEQLALYEIIYEMARRVDALESNAQNTHVAQSGSDKDADLVQIAHRDYTDALRWLEIAATGDLDHSTRISLIEDAINALRKHSKGEVEAPRVLYEGEAWIVDAHPTDPTFHFNSAMLRTSSNRVHVVVTAAEDDES